MIPGRYPILRVASGLYKLAAFLGVAVSLTIFIITEVAGMTGLNALAQMGVPITVEGAAIALLIPFAYLLVGLIGCILTYAFGEFIMLLVDLEYNTRILRTPLTRSKSTPEPELPMAPAPYNPMKPAVRGYGSSVRSAETQKQMLEIATDEDLLREVRRRRARRKNG